MEIPMQKLYKISASFFIFCLLQVTNSDSQIPKWAFSIGDTLSDVGNSTTTDTSGNVYVTGYFSGTVDFDPSAGTQILTANGWEDIFISKYSPSGEYLWAFKVESTIGGSGLSIITDGGGNFFVTGSFMGTADFDPSAATANLISNVGSDIFVAKYNLNGAYQWAINIGSDSGLVGVSDCSGYGITTDGNCNVYITGIFTDTVDFDPSSDTAYLSSNGQGDFFIVKYDSSGIYKWAFTIEVPNADKIDITSDASGNVYVTGYFSGIVDFDPSPSTANLNSNYASVFVAKYDSSGLYQWAINIEGINGSSPNAIAIDENSSVYITGHFWYTADFDPSIDTASLISNGANDIFVAKYDSAGAYLWAFNIGSINQGEVGLDITTDGSDNLYLTGDITGTTDFDPSAATANLTPPNSNFFVAKYDLSGSYKWALNIEAGVSCGAHCLNVTTDRTGNVYLAGLFYSQEMSIGNYTFSSAGWSDIFVAKFSDKGVLGYLFNDLNQNCVWDSLENGIVKGMMGMIDPGNLVVATSNNGSWFLDSLPVGNYSVTFDTSGNWKTTCSNQLSFTVVSPDSFISMPPLGIYNVNPCTEPEVSIIMPFMRPCFSNQKIYIGACNRALATGILDSAFVLVELDTMILLTGTSIPYSMSDSIYRFDIGTLYPGQCAYFTIDATVSCNATLGQTLCIQAELFPVDSCALDSIPDFLDGVTPCTLPWDRSSLKVEGTCLNDDSIRFIIYNTGNSGDGDMQCFCPIRLYIDGQIQWLDSIKINGGDSIVYVFAADGRTWRLEADQHPLHPGNSHPNATVELCGDSTYWTPRMTLVMPFDDADPIIDIFCDITRSSYDPNDKQGIPIGVTDTHFVAPNRQLEYTIRFQNTGTDTAFTVIIRDTLDIDLNIFSVREGASSDDASFRIYGQRVIEWKFENIMLPDSNTNEPESHGFVTFTATQNKDLPNGTMIENSADIYFDFNAPVITNTTMHTVSKGINQTITFNKEKTAEGPQIIVFPNPFSQNATIQIYDIESENINLKFTIYDLSGRELHKQNLKSTYTALNTDLSCGIYFYHVVEESVLMKVGKLIITE